MAKAGIKMGNRGRFGKYGEVKRLKRLKEAKAFSSRATSLSMPKGALPGYRGASAKKALSNRLEVRSATVADARFLARLSDRVFRLYGPYHRIIPKWLESNRVWTLVALYKSLFVGFAMLGPVRLSGEGLYMAELLAIAVDPAWQGRSAGSLLLRKILELAENIGLGEVWLHTAKDNTRARNLFERFGFVTIEEKPNFYTGGQDAVAMVKRLKASKIEQSRKPQ